MRTTGRALTIIGVLSALAGVLWNSFVPTPDANIGAGLLVVLGLPVAGAGILLILIALVVGRGKAGTNHVS